ncbi:ABC transporter permease [Trueperella pyogenes]|uniref:ABC transporter permease n=2 Tax=Trueperella pyogenes TaxID=1661 RepID=UPI00345DB1C3
MKTQMKWVVPVTVGLCAFFAWFAATELGLVEQWILPSPVKVGARLSHGLSEGFLFDATRQTLYEAFLGCFFAAVIGIPLGFAIAHVRLLAMSVQPYLAASQAIPAVAIAPLLVIWVGYGTTPIVVLCTIMVIFPIVINTAVGVRSVDPELVGAARLDGAGSLRLVSAIELPLAAPNIVAGLRNGFTLSVTGAVVGEMVIGGREGLGIVLVGAQALNDIAGMFAAIVILVACAIVIYVLLLIVENRAVEAVSER